MASVNRDIAKILGRTEAANTDNVALASGSGLTVYATPDLLPTSGLTAGDQAFVTSNNRIYISNGSGWYNVALINNTPTFTSGPAGSYALATDLTPTVITLAAQDSDGQVVTYSATPSGMDGIATLSQDSSVFTVTPLHDSAGGGTGSFTITFQATDGVGIASGVSTFTLSFSINWGTASFTTTGYGSYDPTSSGQNASYYGKIIRFSKNGDRVFTSAEQGSLYGVIYVYTQNGSTYTPETALYAGNSGLTIGSSNAGLGHTIDVTDAGDRIVANWNGYHTGQYSTHGCWVVWSRTGSTWTKEQGPVFSNQGTNNAYFAYSVAISGDGNYIVASRVHANNSAGQGYLYYRNGTTWTIAQGFSANNVANDRYGEMLRLSSDGSRVLVLSGTVGVSKFWIHSMIGSGAQADYHSSVEYYGNTGGGCRSGDMNSAGDYVVIGNEASKKVWVYNRVGTTWSLQQTIGPVDFLGDGITTVYNFGYSVSINDTGDVLVVGNRDSYPSTIWIYERSGSTWTKTREIDESAIDAQDSFNSFGEVEINKDSTVLAAGGWYVYSSFSGGVGPGYMKTYVP